MGNKEVLVDSSFFEKMSVNGKNIDELKKVIDMLGWQLVVHPYISEYEMDMFPYFNQLISEGYIRKADYSEFLRGKADKKQYEMFFADLHEEMRKRLNAKGGKKKLDRLQLPKGQNIYSYRKAGMSLGDVHIILMSFFTGIPIILTEDSDICLLRSIAKRLINLESNGYSLEIFSSVDVLKQVAAESTADISKKELRKITRGIGAGEQYTEICQIWEQHHEV